jgi:preprotein translocase subunit Sss1
MLSPALSSISRVISYHLQALGILIYGTVGYICYHEKEPCVNEMK